MAEKWRKYDPLGAVLTVFQFFMVLVVAVLFGPAMVQAQDSQAGDVGFGGIAPPLCSFAALPTELASDNMSLAAGGTNKLQIESLIDPTSGLLNRASIQIEVIGTCNQTHYVSVMTKNGGLALGGSSSAVGGAFDAHVNYRAQIDWGGRTVEMSTDGSPGKKTPNTVVGGANHGPLSLRIVIDDLNNDMSMPLIAGTYTDIITIQIGAPL
jgi:hypothetical protein